MRGIAGAAAGIGVVAMLLGASPAVALADDIVSGPTSQESHVSPYIVHIGYRDELPDGVGFVIGDKGAWDELLAALSYPVWHGDGTCETVVPHGLPDLDEAWFDQGELAVAYASLGSGGYVPAVSSWDESDGTLSMCYVPNTSDSELYTCDMSGFVVIAELPRDSGIGRVELVAEGSGEGISDDGEASGTLCEAVDGEDAQEGAETPGFDGDVPSRAVEEAVPDSVPGQDAAGIRQDENLGEQPSRGGFGMGHGEEPCDQPDAGDASVAMEGADEDGSSLPRQAIGQMVSPEDGAMPEVVGEGTPAPAAVPESVASATAARAENYAANAADNVPAGDGEVPMSAYAASAAEGGMSPDPSTGEAPSEPSPSLGGMLSGMAAVCGVVAWRRQQ